MSNQTSSVAVDCSEGLSKTEDDSKSHEDHKQRSNKEPLSFLLPQLPSALPSAGSISFHVEDTGLGRI